MNGDDSFDPLYIDVKSGGSVTLDASASFDVDGDGLTYQWFQYKEADSFLPASTFRSFAKLLFALDD